ncbi:hypothetical protein SAMN05216417_10530 [Nitrosospira multiformis]|uniref:Uncharacterized protein n=1 Tax=Nitrosospira multiformis TaxID=1231 RepID=A0A1I7GKU3_9PROT|nr:hypothetical protein SAMN05216417_10530 [Nitrosospira multiformis]
MACFERRWIPASAGMTFVLLARRLNKGSQKTDELRPEETGGKQLSESVLHNAGATAPTYHVVISTPRLLCIMGANTRSYLLFNLQANTFGLLLS